MENEKRVLPELLLNIYSVFGIPRQSNAALSVVVTSTDISDLSASERSQTCMGFLLSFIKNVPLHSLKYNSQQLNRRNRG